MPRYLGQGFAEKMGKLAGLPPEDREVTAYGLECLIIAISGLALMLLIGLALGLFREALAVLFCWLLLRIFAGGAHCTALWRCTVVNCAGMLAALLVARGAFIFLPLPLWVAAAAAWALLATLLWAPNNNEKPIYDHLRRRKMRFTALCVVLVLGSLLFYAALSGPKLWLALAAAGAAGMAAGGVMLSPAGFKLVNFMDKMLLNLGNYLKKGGEIP